MKKLLYTTFVLLLFSTTYATHIVGGYISYHYISGTTYEIKLTVYRDCNSQTGFDGAPGSQTPYAIVGLFSSPSNTLVSTYNLTDPDIISIDPPIDNPCLQITSNACVEQGVYTYLIDLPSATQGYTVAYERCCRNGTITNLFDPGNEGAVYSAYIPPTNSFHNSSPVFNNLPPLFICVNSPLIFNYSATDIDGDVLSYNLCTPFSGGSAGNPAPDPPIGPPYNNVNWANPYSNANLLGGAPPLAIDNSSGVLTGTPNSVGQFVFGVCVSEYRNGTLIGTYLRDYQVNVTQCNIPIANIPSFGINPSTGIGTYTINCTDYHIDFINNSYNPPPTSNPIFYHWDFGVAGVTNDTSNIASPTFVYPDSGTYLVTLIVSKGAGASTCVDTTKAYVYLYPSFSTDFTTADICNDIAANFTDGTVSTNAPIAQWQWNFGDGSTSSQQNPNHNYTSPGTYNVTLISRNNQGCKDTAQKPINVLASPVASFNTGPTCINSPITFTNTSGGNIISQAWNFGGGNTSTQVSPSFTYNATGSYPVTLIIATAEGCADTATQNITVHPLPTVTVSNDTTICPFTSVQLFSSGGVSYQWSPTTGLNNPNGANPVATPPPPSTINYTVNVTDANQCSNTGNVNISFYPIPQIDAGIDTSVCLNPGNFHPSVQLQATGGVSYQWSPATGLSATNVANPTAAPSTNTTYYVLGTDANGCRLTDSVDVVVLDPALNVISEASQTICERDTAYVTVINQGASGYSWTPTQYLTDPTLLSPGFFPPDTTNYIITITNYCYTKNDSVLIVVWPLPQLGLNPLDSICINESIQLQVSGAQTYQWDADPTLSATNIADPVATPVVTTRYYVTGTSSLGCVNRDSTLIFVYFPSTIQITPQVAFVCLGTPVQLNVTGAHTYQWQADPTLSATNIANPVALPQDTTTYFVTATNIHGCTTDDSVTLNVQFPVTAVTDPLFDGCKGQPVQLHASGGLYYLWTPATRLNNPFISNPFALPDSTTNYVITVSNDCFSDSAITRVLVHQLPQVDAGPDTTIWRDTEVQLHGSTAASTYFWNPSTWLDDPYDLSTRAEPQQTQYYELFAIDAFGCRNIDSVLITVEPYTVLDIPTAFSPDGNGVNDIFHIVRFLNIEKLLEFSVYNRWGNKVFSTTNLNDGWDGSYKGELQPLGVYVWTVIADAKSGERIVKSGNVTLVR